MKPTKLRLTRLERHIVDCLLAWTYRHVSIDSAESLINILCDADDNHIIEYRCDYGTTIVDKMYVIDKLHEMPSLMEQTFILGVERQRKLVEKEMAMSNRMLRILNYSLPLERFEMIDLKIWHDLILATIKSSSGKEYHLEGPTFKLMMEGFFEWVREGIYDLELTPNS